MQGSTNRGFTLIELSVVLLIIALITGGILIGRDIIRVAEVRATLSQVEELNQAFNAFRLKYQCLPGDCADAESLGFEGNFTIRLGQNSEPEESLFARFSLISPAYAFLLMEILVGSPSGDGNGKIDRCDSEFESMISFSLLAQAKLIDGFNPSTSRVGIPINAHAAVGGVDRPAFWFVCYLQPATDSLIKNANHYFWPVSHLYATLPGGATVIAYDAQAIDTKTDDGRPLTGAIRATSDSTLDFVNGPDFIAATHMGVVAGDFCITNSLDYNVQNPNPMCSVLITAGFSSM